MDLYETQDEKPLQAFTWSEAEQPTAAVVVAVSEVSGEDTTALEPLYNVIDPDSLNSLFAPARSPRLNGSVSFEYHGYLVIIKANGRGFIYEQDESEISSPSLLSTTGQTEDHQ